ncbi:MAG: TRAP transporter substrate-binding protein [Hyphomicrobiales bacterium]
MTSKGVEMRLHCLTTFFFTMFIALSADTAKSADHTLIISSWASPNHSINSRLWPNFIKKLESASKGRLSAKIVYHLAPPSKQLSLIEKGEADIGWVFQGYYPRRFKAASLVTLPGFTASAEALSVAYWRTYEKYLKDQNDYKGLKLLGLMVDGPLQIHSSKPIDTLKDIKDLRLRVSGDASHILTSAFGAKGLHVPTSHIKNALKAKTIDGLLMPLEGRRNFSLNEKVPYVYEMPGGFSRGPYALVMNAARFNALPEDIRETLDNDVLGEALSQIAGQIWDQSDAIGRAATRASEKNKITKASSNDMIYFDKIANSARERVMKKASQAGLDARDAIDFIIKESQAYDDAK